MNHYRFLSRRVLDLPILNIALVKSIENRLGKARKKRNRKPVKIPWL
jgi:hypothetical protein